MKTRVLVSLMLASGVNANAQTELLISISPDVAQASLGDTVTWTFTAQLLNPDPTKTLLATVSDINFSVDHSGNTGPETGLQIVSNSFNPAFDSVFFGPANDGTISGTSILGASGSNTLPPLNNPGGPDSSNPLVIYTYQTLITDGTPRTVSAFPTIHGHFTGAYEGPPFADIFFYQNANGSPGTVPFNLPPVLFYPTLTIVVPAPASATALALGAFTAVRRRRAGR